MTSARRNRPGLRSSAHARWALAALLVVALVLGATLALRAVVGHARRATAVAPTPLGPLRVAAVTAPGTSYEHLALDTSAGHLVALVGSVPRGCPPAGACALGSSATNFVVLDGATGDAIASFRLAGPAGAAAPATILLADSTTHTAYAVSPEAVTRFSTLDAHYEGTSALPGALGGTLRGAMLDSAHGTLVVAGDAALAAVDGDSGAVQATASVPGLAAGPVLDLAAGRLYALVRAPSSGGATMTLMAFDAATLAPQGQLAVPAGTLGPLAGATHALLLFGANGTDYRVALDGPLDAAAVTPAPDLAGALAAGWNATLGHSYRAMPAGLEALDARTGTLLGTLPVAALQPPAQPFVVDDARGMIYLPATDGAVVIARDAPTSGINAPTALLLARAALARFLPDTNQEPPFVAPATFPLGADTSAAGVAHDYWIHFSDLGWKGPYPGNAGTSVAPNARHPGGYIVSFRIAWYQLFARSHTWVCAVAPDGTVSLQSDTGDAVP